MMTKNDAVKPVQDNPFKVMLRDIVSMKHELVLLMNVIESVIRYIKNDHYMERNMLAGTVGDKLNAMFAAVGFNLMKLMKGLGRLFLCLFVEVARFVDFIILMIGPTVNGRRLHPLPLRGYTATREWGFA